MDRDHQEGILQLASYVLDFERRELRTNSGAIVPLRPQSLEVLLCLARRAGQVVRKDELLETVWAGVVVTEDSLVKCIGDIRCALQDDEHRLVRTEPKRGYRLMVDFRPGDPPAEHDFPQQIRFCTTHDGARIAWATVGEGLPLVRAAHWMTHLDWDWRSETLGPRLRRFAKHFRLVRYDGRGCGLSDRDAAPATLDESIADLQAVIDAAGLSEVALLGASGGAAIAIRYAARHPERVRCLALLGGFARGALRRGVPPETVAAMGRLIEDGWGQDNPAFRQLVTTMMWPAASPAQVQSFNHLQRMACAPAAAAALHRAIAGFDAVGDMPGVRCPTLVMHSQHDSRIPFEEGRLMASIIPNARLEVFDSQNHTPLSGEPAFGQVSRWIEEFVDAAWEVRR